MAKSRSAYLSSVLFKKGNKSRPVSTLCDVDHCDEVKGC